MTSTHANDWFRSPAHVGAAVLGLFLFSPGGPYLWSMVLGARLPWSVIAFVVTDIGAILLTSWGMRSLCMATLASVGAAAVLFLWFGQPEAGPGAQLIATYKYGLLSAAGWLGWWRSPLFRWRWAAAVVPSTIACILVIALVAPLM